MRLSVMVLALVCLCAVVIGIAAPAVQDEDVRGAFLTSRPKNKPATSGSATKPGRRRPKQTAANPGKPAEKQTAKPISSGPTASSEPSKPVNVPRIGMGLTLFMRDSNGLAVRTDPAHVFQKGDRVRVLLETNTDGYLYIFNTTNNGPATMIYPHADLDEGGNYIQAHVPFEIPSSAAAQEHLRWFAFDDVAGSEHLFFVFTREPLKGIPLEDELIAFCQNSKDKCPIRPSTEAWEALQAHMLEPLKTDKTQAYGKTETPVEQQATTRGLGLAKDDPQPSLVMMASTARSTLVAALELIHK
ncbi:MAG TPA: DUF4384 domain-containing protein [Pyrinomonadaceae bacterium]|nr:DUF4384 domain-containing protein [Pyrinomonadaceae bacterium]